jgi:hypothetical protein
VGVTPKEISAKQNNTNQRHLLHGRMTPNAEAQS